MRGEGRHVLFLCLWVVEVLLCRTFCTAQVQPSVRMNTDRVVSPVQVITLLLNSTILILITLLFYKAA